MRPSRVPLDSSTVSLGANSAPPASTTHTSRRPRAPHASTTASRISTCMPLAPTCVREGPRTMLFEAAREGSRFHRCASRSAKCAARLADCAATPNECVSRPPFRASPGNSRGAPRLDCVSRLAFRASRRSQRPLSPPRPARSARRATHRSKPAPLQAVLAAFQPTLTTRGSRLAAVSPRRPTSKKPPEPRGVPREARRAFFATTT
jgi:hypothetical protein